MFLYMYGLCADIQKQKNRGILLNCVERSPGRERSLSVLNSLGQDHQQRQAQRQYEVINFSKNS